MENNILGLHHITAIAGSAQSNFAFYTQVLGLRLVKKTVNFDDPGTYHFYFGNETGTPGTILTFFPWEGIGKGRAATGMATEINFSVPEGSLAFWKNRLEQAGAEHRGITERFGQGLLQLQDNDGLTLNLIAGIFGMNFEFLPLIHSDYAMWVILALMTGVGAIVFLVFWRKRYLARTGR